MIVNQVISSCDAQKKKVLTVLQMLLSLCKLLAKKYFWEAVHHVTI